PCVFSLPWPATRLAAGAVLREGNAGATSKSRTGERGLREIFRRDERQRTLLGHGFVARGFTRRRECSRDRVSDAVTAPRADRPLSTSADAALRAARRHERGEPGPAESARRGGRRFEGRLRGAPRRRQRRGLAAARAETDRSGRPAMSGRMVRGWWPARRPVGASRHHRTRASLRDRHQPRRHAAVVGVRHLLATLRSSALAKRLQTPVWVVDGTVTVTVPVDSALAPSAATVRLPVKRMSPPGGVSLDRQPWVVEPAASRVG